MCIGRKILVIDPRKRGKTSSHFIASYIRLRHLHISKLRSPHILVPRHIRFCSFPSISVSPQYMLKVLERSIQYFPGEDLVDFPLFFPDFSLIKTEIASIQCNNGSHTTYENWRQSYPLEDEILMVEKAIERAKDGHRIHIRGITLSDSVKILSGYYQEKGYENENKHFEIPVTELLTVSVFFGNFLWSEKDKVFLEKRLRDDPEYIRSVTPVMTSHDLRIIQQGVRSGLLPLLEIHPSDMLYISQCVSREIIALYDLGQRITFSWKNMGFFHRDYEGKTDRDHIFFELPQSTFGIQN